MDIPELTNIEQILPLKSAENLKKTNISEVSDDQKKQIAKDFESLLINELLDEMKNTIGSWGFEKDGASSQVQGIFWMYLAQDISNNGGLGLWEDIYKSIPELSNTESTQNSIDGLL